MQKFISQIHSTAENIAKRYNLKVYDVSLKREPGGRVLRINLEGIDKQVSLEDCAEISQHISAWLDEKDGELPYSYTLEVSSLGIDRPLKGFKEFDAHKGKLCSISARTKDSSGRKRYKGKIKSVSENFVVISIAEENKDFAISFENIAKAKLAINWEEYI